MLYVALAASFTSQHYWWVFPNRDCGYDDVPGNCSGKPVSACEKLCDSVRGCAAFNSNGWLKKADCESRMAPASTVLYIRKDVPQPPPPPPPWGELWPVPQSFRFVGGVRFGAPFPLRVPPSFAVAVGGGSSRLERAAARYTALIRTAAAAPSPPPAQQPTAVPLLKVAVDDTSERLTQATDYSYSLRVDGGGASASAPSIYGAMAAMETFSQLVRPGGFINATSVVIDDAPSYPHRGFMADTGRRFWPVRTVESLLDAMAMSKMNVLHLHLSDNCRFAVESAAFPALTKRLVGPLGGFYSHDDIRSLVLYAADRGIRVIPEVDMPGHAQGLQGLGGGGGLVFCDEGRQGDRGVPYGDLQNDANGTTIATLKILYDELAELFPDAELFIGADETAANGPCTTATDYAPIERAVCDHITSLNRTVGGWEEYAFTTHVAQPNDRFVVNTWHYVTQAQALTAGYQTVAANDSHFYLVYDQPADRYWVDIASGTDPSRRRLLRGGIVSAWGDEYCYVAYCIHLDKFPSAHALFPPSADALFHKSILGVAFPRAAVGAGSFWNWNASVTSSQLDGSIAALNARLIARGVPACPSNCTCNAASRCGVPYANESVATLPLEELLSLPGSRIPAGHPARRGR